MEANYFQSVVDSSPDCIRIIDLEGRVEFVNAGGRRLLGIGPEATFMMGRYWPDLWPESERGAVEAAWRAAVAGETRSFRACFRRQDGAMLWLDTLVAPVFAGREVSRVLATSRDVTEEVEARALIDTILDCVPAALFVKELEAGRLVFLNQSAETLFGHSAQEMIGKTARAFVLPNQADTIRDADLQAAASGGAVVIDGETVTQSDGRTHVRRTRKKVTPGPGARYVVCLTEDITEEKAREEALRQALADAQEASRAKSQFLAIMGHEIRSPLNGVLGMAQAMAMDELPPEQRRRLQVIQESGRVLLDLLNDMLDLSRIAAGKLQLEEGLVDGAELACVARSLFDGLAADKDLSFQCRLDPEAAGPWRGDPLRVRQIVANLIGNAVKFTERGQVAFALQVRDGALVLEVSDTGPGIAAELQARIFEPFHQIDPSNTRRHGGSGLGLAICRTLAEMMAGSIAVRSAPGEGATFTVRLPLPRAEPAPAEPAAGAAGGAAAASDRPLRILAAEDNPMNRLVLTTLLGAAGLTPHLVANGEEAVQAWRAEPWDLILMDVQMPVMDGMDATRAIRAAERAEGRARTPIVALTANAMQHQREEYAACGMDALVPKPLEIQALLQAIYGLAAAPQPRGCESRASKAPNTLT